MQHSNRHKEADLASAADQTANASPDDQFWVDVDGYEGPLHLLMELARAQKVDLIHVSILKVAEQYLEFVFKLKARRIDLAADYLLMASWLAFMKSRLLLPKLDQGEVEEGPDGEAMARRLAFRLKRLEALRGGMKKLWAGDVTGRDVFVRGMPEKARVVRKSTYDASLYDVMSAFADIQNRKAKQRAHIVERQPVLTLDSARDELKAQTKELDDWKAIQSFQAPVGEADDTPRKSVIASFMSAALELTRDNDVELRQDAPLTDVYVRRARRYMKSSKDDA